MDCSDIKPPTQRFYRYTIPRLLELASLTFLPFDLSHFSYDAVRAGIIPALAACAMAPGDNSTFRDRGRGVSTETTGSENDIAHPAHDMSAGVFRQPDGAPTGERRQKDEGFDRFLRKHASPNHHRVTAGGRIVPMEQRPAPPRFDLHASRNNRNVSGGRRQSLEPFPKLSIDTNMPHQSSFQFNSALSPVMGSGAFFPSPTGTFAAMGPATSTGSLGFGMTPAYLDGLSYGMDASSTWGVPLCGPLPQFSPGPTVAMSPYAPVFPDWSYVPQYGAVNNITSPLSADFPPFHESSSLLQQQVDHAQATFDALGQQLKDLDRHRAMHPRDEEVVSRRKAVVEQRARALEHLRGLEKALHHGSNSQHFLSPTTPATATPSQSAVSAAAGHKFNVEAQAWVPTRSSGSARVDIKAPESSQAMSAGPAAPKELPVVENDPVDESNVDQWGVQVGCAPPELERQQSQLSESLLGMVSPVVSSVDDGELPPVDEIDTIAEKRPQSPALSVAASEASSEGEQVQPGRAPPAVEREYELQLDALRKPKGQSTLIYMSDGRVLSVDGQDLQRPAWEEMNDFEKGYWLHRTGRSSLAPAELSQANVSAGILSNVSGGVNATAAKRRFDDSLEHFKLEDPFKAFAEPGSPHAKTSHRMLADQVWPDAEPFDMNNKAFSSVAVQSVHALSRLPQNLDGATDASLRKVLHPDHASSKKARSPKLLYRSKASGDAWLGPFRRNFFDPGNPDHDHVHK